MKKTVLSVAAAGVFAVPAALAQTSSVQLYGRAVLGIDHYEAKGARSQGATPGSAIDYDGRVRIYDNSSRVGLRGTEDLGNGLKAIFQIETGVNVDNGSNTGQSGGGNANTGFWASRDSFVGLDSNFGRLTFGRQSVYWANGVNAQFSANYINSQVPWTDGTQLGRISRGPAGAVARYNNVAQYTSPTFAGINGTLSYSPTNQEAVQSSSTTDTNGDMWGVTLRGTWGPFYAQADWARQKLGTPAAGGTAPFAAQGVTPEWEGYKLGASWGYLPGARIGADLGRRHRALGRLGRFGGGLGRFELLPLALEDVGARLGDRVVLGVGHGGHGAQHVEIQRAAQLRRASRHRAVSISRAVWLR
jgi:predicted porin